MRIHPYYEDHHDAEPPECGPAKTRRRRGKVSQEVKKDGCALCFGRDVPTTRENAPPPNTTPRATPRRERRRRHLGGGRGRVVRCSFIGVLRLAYLRVNSKRDRDNPAQRTQMTKFDGVALGHRKGQVVAENLDEANVKVRRCRLNTSA